MARRVSPHAWFGVPAALATVALALVVRGYLRWPGWLCYLAAVNAVTGALYLYDKVAAGGRDALRVPEAILHAAAFAGGTPAALGVGYALRHKTSKARFRRVFWLLTVVQAAAVGWWVAR